MKVTTAKDTEASATIPAQARTRATAKASSDASLFSARYKANKPLVVGSALGVVLCSLGAAVTAGLFDDKTEVLVVESPIAAGQIITGDMLRTVPVAADAGVTMVPASRASAVLGRPATVPLTPGSLLSPAEVGPGTYPPAGEAEVAVSLRQGSFPLDLAQGDRVQVVVASDTALAAGAAASAAAQAQVPTVAVVTKVGKVDSQGAVVADLLTDQDLATKVAAAGPSAVSLAIIGPGGSETH